MPRALAARAACQFDVSQSSKLHALFFYPSLFLSPSIHPSIPFARLTSSRTHPSPPQTIQACKPPAEAGPGMEAGTQVAVPTGFLLIWLFPERDLAGAPYPHPIDGQLYAK